MYHEFLIGDEVAFQGILVMPRDIFGCHNEGWGKLLASSGQSPGAA